MNYEILEKLLDRENLDIKKIWKFFGAENKEGITDIIIKNFKEIQLNPDDAFIYGSAEAVYEACIENNHNIFYEKLVIISFFLKGFANYNDVVIQAFIQSIGTVSFILTFEKIFKDNQAYDFFKNAIKEYKQDKYFREQTDRVLTMFNEVADQFENLDLKEAKHIIEKIKALEEK